MVRDGLWQLVRQRPELFERGARVVAEHLELGTGELGRVDGLLRDVAGGAILVFATDERDLALPARVFAANAFWQRNSSGLPRALPEAELGEPVRCRLLVVGGRLSPGVVQALEQLRLDHLEVVEVEPFQVGGEERLAIRTMGRRDRAQGGGPGEVPGELLDAAIDAREREVFAEVATLLGRLDPRIRIDGDRFSRRASMHGRILCEYWYDQERVVGVVPGTPPRPLQGSVDVRSFGDRVARRYLSLRGAANGTAAPAAARGPSAGQGAAEAGPGAGRGFDLLRASVTASRLSHEECSALGDPGAGEDSR